MCLFNWIMLLIADYITVTVLYAPAMAGYTPTIELEMSLSSPTIEHGNHLMICQAAKSRKRIWKRDTGYLWISH